ncbi:MAG: HlyD family secretion protein [Candidatus Parcubacteria bacterium]|jgi:RND family efflux transporter MFP subunit|nr:HlyD family secretion protein [Candidatus Parcubacteria bacterium]
MTILSYVRRHSFVASVIAVLAVIVMIIAGRQANEKEGAVSSSALKKVDLVSVETFRTGYANVAANGVVESEGQADLKSQISAPVAAVHGAIGGIVNAGDVIIELENSDVKAQLAQSKASLALAEGQYYTGGVSVGSAEKNAVNKIRDSYTKSNDALSSQIDPLLFDVSGTGWQLSALCQQRRTQCRLVETRNDFNAMFIDWKGMVNSLTASSTTETIEAALSSSQANLGKIDAFLGDVSQALTDASQSQSPAFGADKLTLWKGMVSGALAAVSGAESDLVAAESTLSGAGATHQSTGEAQINVARAGVNNLEAQLAKTIIRSPIAGKIAALPLEPGELASAGALVATVVGEGGLHVKAYASGEDFSRIAVGAPAAIQGSLRGNVSSVAPSVSETNKKVEVIVSVSDADSANLVIGQNVVVSIEAPKTSIASDSDQAYRLPIQDVKIEPGNAYVYTVDQNSKIKRIPVTLGAVEGDFLEVKSGLSPDLKIASPVYELEDGQEVRVSE